MPQQTGRPLPAYVYRRRRLAVFGGLVLIIVAVLPLTRPWGGGKTPGADSVKPMETPGTSQTQASETAACDPGQVKVTPLTDAESYAAGEFPQLTVQVENTGSDPCSLNVGTSQQVFTITSGSEIYWLSSDCQKESSDFELVITPGEPVKSEPIQWDRTRSNPGTCTVTQRDPVPAGGATYSLTVSIGGVTSAGAASFTLN